MYVEQTTNKLFAIQDLTEAEISLLMNGLIAEKQHSLQDAEAFKDLRASCNEMFQKIDQEIRRSR